MIKTLIYTSISIFLISCASMQLKPYKGELTRTYIENIQLSKNEAFERSVVWLAKNVGDSNHAIKLNDSKSGRLVAKIIYPCKGLKRPDVVVNIESTDVNFNIDIAVKEKKIKYELEMIGFTRDLRGAGLGLGFVDYQIAEAPGQSESVNACFESLKKTLMETVSKTAPKSNW